MAAAWNQLVYYGARVLAADRPHSDWTLPIDRAVPFLPWTVAVYFGCFLFWAVSYLFLAGREKEQAYRFFCADFLAKTVCLACFVLLPTTNVRPAVEGRSVWDALMRLLYRIDAPNNLFPSIHCLVSWLCWVGVRSRADVPRRYRGFSFLMAAAVCLSTLTTRQHVAADVAGGIALAELCYWAAGLEPVARRYSQIMDRLFSGRTHKYPVDPNPDAP